MCFDVAATSSVPEAHHRQAVMNVAACCRAVFASCQGFDQILTAQTPNCNSKAKKYIVYTHAYALIVVRKELDTQS